VPFTRQTLFFTATMPTEIRRITEQFLHNPVKVEVSRPATTVTAITQQLVKCGRDPADKREVLRQLVRASEGLKNGIVFCNRKSEVATVYRSLKRHGFSVLALHGDMSQPERTAALDAFRKNEVTLLVASDVAARGLDIPDVSHIYNFDVPHHADDYVHRIGRTGRAGRSGVAITLVSPADTKSVAAIEKLTGQSIAWMGDLPAGDNADPAAEPAATERDRPARREGGRSGRSRNRKPQDRSTAAPARPNSEAPDAPRPQRPDVRHPPRPNAHRPAANRVAEPRPPRREPEHDSDASHLPAFLLRPVSIKA
jgi:superfamily II DNA/RNA helicase